MTRPKSILGAFGTATPGARIRVTHGAIIATLIALLAVGLAGPQTARAQRPASTPADTLVIAYSATPIDLDPATTYDSGSTTVLRAFYEGLVKLKGSSTDAIEGALAQSWSVNADKSVYTFHLRHGVTFHDGTPFTSEAVKLSYTRVLALNQGAAFVVLGTFVTAKGIQTPDAYTVQFHLIKPSPIFLQAMTAQWGAIAIISPAAMKKHPKDLHTWLQSHEDGTGPYTLQSFVPGQNYTFVRYPAYWGGWSGRHVAKILERIVVANATRRELVTRGDADITDSLTYGDLAAMQHDPNLFVSNKYGARNLSLVMTQYGPLQSTAARQAMCYAFDYNAFIKDLLHGYGIEAQGPMPRTMLGHDNSLYIYPTDLTKAKALLQKAGVAPGTKLTLWYQAEDEITKNAAEVMQGQLALLGLNLEIKSVDLSAFINAYYGNEPPSKRPNFWIWYWYPDYNDPGDWLDVQYASSAAGSAGSNGGFYKDATVDSLIDKAHSAVDLATRISIYKQVQRALVADPPAVWLADLPEQTVLRRTVHGYQSNPAYTDTYDFYALYK